MKKEKWLKQKAERERILELRERRKWGISVRPPDERIFKCSLRRKYEDDLMVYRATCAQLGHEVMAYHPDTAKSKLLRLIRRKHHGNIDLQWKKQYSLTAAECATLEAPDPRQVRADARMDAISAALRGDGPLVPGVTMMSDEMLALGRRISRSYVRPRRKLHAAGARAPGRSPVSNPSASGVRVPGRRPAPSVGKHA